MLLLSSIMMKVEGNLSAGDVLKKKKPFCYFAYVLPEDFLEKGQSFEFDLT